MMDLNQIVMDSFKKIQADGYVESVVEKKLKSTLEDIVSDMFRSYGDFGKQLKEQLTAQIQVNLEELNFSHYNQIVLAIVKEKLDETMGVYGAEQMKEHMDKLLSTAKSEWKLSELVEEMKKRELEYNDEPPSEITMLIERLGSLTWIYLDPEPDTKKHSCDYNFTVIENGTVSNVRLRDHDVKKSRDLMGSMFGFENIVFQLYAAGSKIIIDEDDVDVYYPSEE